jgi:hypothetical protein
MMLALGRELTGSGWSRLATSYWGPAYRATNPGNFKRIDDVRHDASLTLKGPMITGPD